MSTRPVFAFIGLYAEKDIAPDSRALESIVLTELVRMGIQENFGLVVPRNREDILARLASGSLGDLADTPGTRGMIAGDLRRTKDGVRLRIGLFNPKTAEITNSVEYSEPTLSSLAEGIKSRLYALFGLQQGPSLHAPLPPAIAADGVPDPSSGSSQNPTMKDISGSWKGDKGIEEVQIKDDGSALASLGNFNKMRLAVIIEDDYVVVRQDEPNSPKLYMNSYPYSTAQQMAETARPMRWVFNLSRDKKILRGIKESSSFTIEDGRILATDNSFSREAVWIKLQ